MGDVKEQEKWVHGWYETMEREGLYWRGGTRLTTVHVYFSQYIFYVFEKQVDCCCNFLSVFFEYLNNRRT